MWSGIRWCGCLYKCENGNSPKYSSEGGLSMSNNIFLVRRSSSSSGWATEAPVWGQGNNNAIRGSHFNPPFSWILPLFPPRLSQKMQKMLILRGKKDKRADFRLERFAKIQLQQIQLSWQGQVENLHHSKTCSGWSSVSLCPLRETWPWLGPRRWSTSFCTIQTCKNTLTLTNPLDSAFFSL